MKITTLLNLIISFSVIIVNSDVRKQHFTNIQMTAVKQLMPYITDRQILMTKGSSEHDLLNCGMYIIF